MNRSGQVIGNLLRTAGVTINGQKPYDIQVHDERFYKRALADRELGIGEAYMGGWWSSHKLDETVSRLLSANLQDAMRPSPALIKTAVAARLTNPQKKSKAYKNASAHYAIGNDLYERMLDSRMIYSCAFWRGAKTLEEAQVAKLDRICKKLHLRKGMTLLDIGCGWGGFSKYAAENYGVKVTGVSPVAEQVKVAKERTKDLDVTILQKDFREITGKYDRIVSIGMFEHVGPKNYQRFFDICNDLMNDDGIMLHHTIGNTKTVKATDPWINKYIFPGGVIPSIAQIARAAEGKLVIEDLENFGPDYDKTLLAWHKNFVKNYPEIKDKYDERFNKMWEYYLLSCAGAFRARKIQLWQIVLSKIRPSETYIPYR